MAIQFDNGGELVSYRPVAERMPEFIALYPPREGWAVHKEVIMGETLFPERMALYRLCVEKGLDPTTLGLPAFPATLVMVRAALFNPDQRLVAEAHALGNLRGEKDLEALETAAFGRLMTTVGIVGDMASEIHAAPVAPAAPSMGTVAAASGPQEVVPVPLAATRSGRSATPVTPLADAPSAPPVPAAAAENRPAEVTDAADVPEQPDAVATPTAAPAALPPAAPVASDPREPAPVREPVPLVLTAQIAALADAKGQEPPVPTSPRHAREILKALRNL
ncbi:MAG: hypothetical protein EOM72_12535 [Opitutae bacterium]|nr:hypothetical protein [Opitutae bacterium]